MTVVIIELKPRNYEVIIGIIMLVCLNWRIAIILQSLLQVKPVNSGHPGDHQTWLL